LTPNSKAVLVGSNEQDVKKQTRVSLHHNWFEGVDARNSRVHGGTLVHMWNNYISNWVEYGVGVSALSDVLIQNNIFENSKNKNAVDPAYGVISANYNPSGSVAAIGNLLLGSPVLTIGTVGAFPMDEITYFVTPELADDNLKNRIIQGAGANNIAASSKEKLIAFPASIAIHLNKNDSGGTYRNHEEMIEMYKNECTKFPKVSSFTSIGKTHHNNDIWAFTFGNPNGGKIIIDGCLHGWEDMGSELAFLWIKWLLESNDPVAKKILKENCWIVVPVINYDTYQRGNLNQTVCQDGIDLNRNFVHNWKFVPDCTGPFGTSHGAMAGSEKETQVMSAFMEANKPTSNKKSVYINTHYGGGPWIHYQGKDFAGYYTPLRNKIVDSWNSKSIVLKNITVDEFLPSTPLEDKTPGMAADDAADYGYEAFIVETLARACVDGHKFGPLDAPCKGESNPSYDRLKNELYPIYEQFFLAVSKSVSQK